MFNPCFQSLWVLENYVGWGNVIHFIIEYDAKVVIPHLIIIFDVLNLTIQLPTAQVDGSYVGVVVVERKRQ